MTTAPDHEQQPATPVVHLSRRAALEAERAAAARKPRRAGRTAATARATTEHAGARPAQVAPTQATRAQAASAQPAPADPTPVRAQRSRPARVQRSTQQPTRQRPGRQQTRVPSDATGTTRVRRASRLNPLRPANRTSRITVTSAIAAFVLFAASAMPAHASSGASVATSTLAPAVRGQDYSVTQLASVTDAARDGFSVGGGSDGTPGTSVSYGGEVRSPFPGPVQMSSGFGYRSAPCGACSSLHEGLDFTPGLGTPIGAVAKGTVRVAGTYFSYGTAVVIDHEIDGRKVATLYGHMIPGSTPLKVGDTVEAGEFIGQVGNSGVSTGAHLHLEVLMDGITPIDPEAWLEARIGRSLTS